MESKKIRDLIEAYSSIYESNCGKEEVEQIDEADSIAAMRERAAKRRKQRYGASDTSRGGRDDYRPYTKADYERGEANDPRKKTNEEVDIFDTILEHLVAEGYADTNEAALAIMANMSEEWRQSIVEGPVGEFADNVARTAGTAVGTVQRGADYLRQKARNVAGTFEIARDRAASGMPSNAIGPFKPQPRSREFSHGGPGQTKPAPMPTYPIPGRSGVKPDDKFYVKPKGVKPDDKIYVKPAPMPGSDSKKLPFGVNPGGPNFGR